MDERDDEFDSEEKTTTYPASFSVRLSTEEREELAKLAPDQPWGQYIKDVIFREKHKPRTREAQRIKDHKLLARLLGLLGQSRISQNINQLAKAANSGSLRVTPDVHKALLEATRAIQHMRALLIEAMGLKAHSDDPQGETRTESEEAVILKGSQRGGARQMALHLMNGQQNEHVSVYQIKGFVADSVLGALNEAYALSKGTQCRQFMFSLSMNPPAGQSVPVEDFEDALERIEKKLGLTGQPRVVVFHEKEGRRHAHCVWSRIDVEAMKAINLPYTKRKPMDVAKQLYLEHGWTLPKGFIDPKRILPPEFGPFLPTSPRGC